MGSSESKIAKGQVPAIYVTTPSGLKGIIVGVNVPERLATVRLENGQVTYVNLAPTTDAASLKKRVREQALEDWS